MTPVTLWQFGTALLVVGTPWFVTRTAGTAVARAIHPHAANQMRLLNRVTATATLGVALVVLLARSSLPVALAEAGAFIGLAWLGWRTLRAFDEITRPVREIEEPTRVASLAPRRMGHYVPLEWRTIPLGILVVGLAVFAFRLAGTHATARLWIPMAFAVTSAVFFALYEIWLRQEVSGGRIVGTHDLESCPLES